MKSISHIACLSKACAEAGNQYQFATKHHLSPQYVRDVLKGRTQPGPKMLKALGLRKVVSYKRT